MQYLQQALLVRRQSGDVWGEAQTLDCLAKTMHDTGRLDQARVAWRQALDIFEQLGDPQAAEIQAHHLNAATPDRDS